MHGRFPGCLEGVGGDDTRESIESFLFVFRIGEWNFECPSPYQSMKEPTTRARRKNSGASTPSRKKL